MDTTTKIAVCSRSFSQNKVLREELLKKFSNVKFNDEGVSLNGEPLIEFLQGVEGAIVALEYITEDILNSCKDLKFIGKYGVGLDKLDLDSMSSNGVKMGWTAGVNSRAVAELTVGLAIDIVRDIKGSRKVVSEGNWTQIKGKQISSLTIGVLGFGHVGSKVAKIMTMFDANVIAYDKQDLSAEMTNLGVKAVDLETLIRDSDLLTVHVPHNVSNHHIIDRGVMFKMKKGSFVINTARGGLVDESALLEMLENGHIEAAALDVLEAEPPENNPLLIRDDVVVTSHIGGSSQEAILAMGRAAINGLINYTNPINFKKYL